MCVGRATRAPPPAAAPRAAHASRSPRAALALVPRSPPPPPSLTDVEEETGYYVREFPNPQFIEEVREAFPDKMVASPDEARVSGG